MSEAPSHSKDIDSLHQMVRQVHKAVKRKDFKAASQLQDRIRDLPDAIEPRTIHELAFMARQALQEDAKGRRYIFVSGAPRSGTTAVGKLLQLHPECALFTELFSANFGYVPQMFEASNIMRSHQLGILQSLERHRNMETLERLATATLVGDKRPNFMHSAPLTLHQFRGEKLLVVHIVRDPYEVAFSYSERARKGIWRAQRDHTVAVQELNDNNAMVLSLIESGLPSETQSLIVLNYQTFWRSQENFRRFFELVGLDADRVPPEVLSQKLKISEAARAKHRALSDEERSYIEANFDFRTHDAVVKHSVP